VTTELFGLQNIATPTSTGHIPPASFLYLTNAVKVKGSDLFLYVKGDGCGQVPKVIFAALPACNNDGSFEIRVPRLNIYGYMSTMMAWKVVNPFGFLEIIYD
jgi:hypothetical protein